MTVVIHWFRKALRLHDNPALLHAIDACKMSSSSSLLPIFILDPHFVQHSNIGINRWSFLLQSLKDLDHSLLSASSKLLILRGQPVQALSDLVDHLRKSGHQDISLFFERDTEPYARVRDAAVMDLCVSKKITVESFTSHTLFDPAAIIKANGGHVPISYQPFCKIINEKMPPVTAPLPAPTSMPGVGDKVTSALHSFTKPLKYNAFDLPTLKEIGKENKAPTTPSIHPGGETEALRRFEEWMAQKEAVCKFEKPNTNPAAFNPASTTILSPYLKMGCISSRTFYHRLMSIYRHSKNGYSKPPVSLLGQLYWREFFYCCGYGIENFDRMRGNRICRQIDWRQDSNSDADLERWANAQTGYPWIDAIMTQLRQEGWIHHLARHSVACFLTRGDLYISWERGAAVFDQLLIDADWSLNTGNWLWLSASAFFHQYFRVYSPVAFAKKYAPQSSAYIRHYLPALKDYPERYLFEPWKAPLGDQKRANCIIGKDYPRPICDHELVSKVNLGKMKAAYSAASPSSGSSSSSNSKKRPLED